jgi:Bifunctional DNA primase/polymerase, N-terminal
MTTVNAEGSQIQFLNESADFWRYDIGVNVIPADTINKRPIVTWAEWQDRPIPEELHNRWIEQGAFSNGIALVPGKIWHSKEENKRALYLVFIDADKRIGIEEFFTRNGKIVSLREASQKFLIEQHADSPDKAHIYFYSPIPFPQKTADSILGLEVKGLGKHGIAFCFPSIHKDGMQYEIMGTNHPVILTIEQARDLIQHIDQICLKHKLQYLEKDTFGSLYSSSPIVSNNLRNIIHTLSIDTTVKIPKGERHVTLISVADSILFNHLTRGKDKTEKELKKFFEQINHLLCEPEPLLDNELCSIWNSAVNFVSRVSENEKVKGKEKALNGESNNGIVQEENERSKKSYYVQKYRDSESLAESLIIAGKPYFAVARPKPDSPSEIQVTFEESITLADETTGLRPYELMSYMNRPYLFRSNEEFESYLELARKETLDSLYRKVKNIFGKSTLTEMIFISLYAQQTPYSPIFKTRSD